MYIVLDRISSYTSIIIHVAPCNYEQARKLRMKFCGRESGAPSTVSHDFLDMKGCISRLSLKAKLKGHSVSKVQTFCCGTLHDADTVIDV